MRYKYNPYCSCPRCRTHGYMGPAVLITLGVLFLLSQSTGVGFLSFHHTWPALLIVIGLVLFIQHSTPDTGHVPRGYVPVQAVSPSAMQPQPSPVVTPAPMPPAGNLPQSGYVNPDDQGVHNG